MKFASHSWAKISYFSFSTLFRWAYAMDIRCPETGKSKKRNICFISQHQNTDCCEDKCNDYFWEIYQYRVFILITHLSLSVLSPLNFNFPIKCWKSSVFNQVSGANSRAINSLHHILFLIIGCCSIKTREHITCSASHLLETNKWQTCAHHAFINNARVSVSVSQFWVYLFYNYKAKYGSHSRNGHRFCSARWYEILLLQSPSQLHASVKRAARILHKKFVIW